MQRNPKKKGTTLRMKSLSALLALLIAATSFTGCASANSSTQTETASQTATTSITGKDVTYSEADQDASYDAATAVNITLSGTSAKSSGSGATIEGTIVTIKEAGTYLISGTLSDGQIVVAADDDANVQIVLAGATITSSNGPAIYVQTCDKTTITLASDTTNRIEDSATYTLADGEDEPNAAIFSKSDLTINGEGTLVVNGNFENGIVSKDDLVITGGNISVIAVNDGIKGRDSVAILDGTFAIETETGDGVQASNDEDTEKGWVSIDGGTFTIHAAAKGIKAETLLQVNAGDLTITAIEDGLHSNTNLLVTDGDLTISATDDGLHANATLEIDGGSILIAQSYEAIEASNITVTGGTIDLTASDDGFNAAGGNDGSSTAAGSPGSADSFAESGDYLIRITGGSITVNAQGDGIDSNGSISYEGGTILVSGPTNNGNGPMDYNGTCNVTGGTLAIAGSAGMAQAPSDTSTQASVTVYFTATQAAGTTVELLDSSGNTVVSYAPTKEFSSIVLSDDSLAQGETYTLMVNNTQTAEVTLSTVVTKIAEDGSTVTGGTSGPGGGGMGGGPSGGMGGQKGNHAPPQQPSTTTSTTSTTTE